MTRRLAALAVCLALLVLLVPAGSASAVVVAFPGVDCKESPTPDMPGQGLPGFFEQTPDPIPRQADPFAGGASTTMYEQYGYSGLRWRTYDLGCGPDAARNPDAVIGTALSNWILNVPIAWSALTSSITEVAFEPSFLTMFDPAISRVSRALHRSLFATWVPAVIALLGIAILLKARRSALATTAASIGWALMVVLLATAVFRWPLAAGHFADGIVTDTLGSVVGGLDGEATDVSPATTIGSNVQESIFYSSWLAGTLGSTDSPTARKYGGRLFKAQALTWHEAYVVQHDPEAGKRIIEGKKDAFQTLASEIQSTDPMAYEHLTGKRSDTRVGYAILSALAAFLALPFLFVSSLLLIGSFLIVRLAVMLFPAFATLGVFPAGRGLVVGMGRTVGAALINAVIFGIGAAVTIRVLGLILDPENGLPGWLALVLMPLFSFVMWVALKPFRRLTAMVSPGSDPFGDAAGALGDASRNGGRWVRQAGTAVAATYTGNVAAAATATDALHAPPPPDRVEARHSPADPDGAPEALQAVGAPLPIAAAPAAEPGRVTDSSPGRPIDRDDAADPGAGAADVRGPVTSESAPLVPVEPEWVDGEEVFTVYRPEAEDAHDAA